MLRWFLTRILDTEFACSSQGGDVVYDQLNKESGMYGNCVSEICTKNKCGKPPTCGTIMTRNQGYWAPR